MSAGMRWWVVCVCLALGVAFLFGHPGQSLAAPRHPPMYLVGDGPPGSPVSRECPGCAALLEADASRALSTSSLEREFVGGRGSARDRGFPEPIIHPLGAETASDPSFPLQSPTGWQVAETQGFELDWPWGGACQFLVDGSNDGLDRTWGAATGRAYSGQRALWPAAGGADALAPDSPVDYPPDLDSWLICGPLDFSRAGTASAAFWLWLQTEGSDDLFFGVGDGSDDWFQGYTWDGPAAQWNRYRVYFPAYAGTGQDSTWLAWNFRSDGSNPTALEGAWLDDIEVSLSLPCPIAQPGPKGLNVHPDEALSQMVAMADAGADWVRLEFQADEDGFLDLGRYEELVDGLCQQGVALVPLLDYATLSDDLDGDGTQDYDDPTGYLAYQQRFTETVEALAHHFRGGIDHWEIWNEENGGQWHIRPEYYARLLVHTSRVLKEIDDNNRVLFGGLDHVWATSQYLEPVYAALDETWGGARPFDILAVHPYFTVDGGRYVLDPSEYLWDEAEPPQTTLDPYLSLMADKGDADVDIWITEIGWNSALGNPALDNCPGMAPWCVDWGTQAAYLADSLDILFDGVEDPLGSHERVGAVAWYQWQDTAVPVIDLARWLAEDAAQLASPDAICPADWGLVDGNHEPKPAHWAYQIWPRHVEGWALASFEAQVVDGGVRVRWRTMTETELEGFYLHRAGSATGQHALVNGSLIASQAPGTSGGAAYQWLDVDAAPGVTHFYWLEGLTSDMASVLYGPARVTTEPEAPPPLLSASSDGPSVLGAMTTLSATIAVTTTPVLTYTWAFGDGGLGKGPVATHTYSATGAYTALVTATGWLSGGQALVASTDTLTTLLASTVVVVEEEITGLAVLNDSPTALGTPTWLTAEVEAGTGVTFTWAFGDGALGPHTVVSHTYPEVGVYTAVVTAANLVSLLTATTGVVITPRVTMTHYVPLVWR